MPAYEYTCTNCQAKEVRITGIDDHTVLCDTCGQVMVRQMDWDALMASYAPKSAPAESKA